MILDTIVARKKEEVAALKLRGLPAPQGPIEPPRGAKAGMAKAPQWIKIPNLAS